MSYTLRQSVITKTPLRISLGGGGTDLPFYAKERGGFLITGAIDEYITVSMAVRPLDDRILIQTTSTQFANALDEVENKLIRETLRYFSRIKSVQIATFSTLPTGIGLGSSSTQIVGMARALGALDGRSFSPMEIAGIAYKIEREILKLAGGVQDQYISALGGIQILTVETDGRVSAKPLIVNKKALGNLERGLVLIYSGRERDSSDIIRSQEVGGAEKMRIYDAIKEIGRQSVPLLENGDVRGLGEAMDEHWRLKKQLSRDMSSDSFDGQYEQLKAFGSPGGKLVGAGGGGFFMMAVPGDVEAYLRQVYRAGYRALDFCFDFEGSHIINQVPDHKLGAFE